MVPNSPAANRYREIAIRTATPLQLVVILYDGAIQALQEAQEHLRRGNIAGRSRCVNRAVSLLSELQASLDFKAGGEIAQSLERLYNYMKQRIFTGNLQQKGEPLAEVAALLDNLRSAWRQLAAETAPVQAAEAFPAAAFPSTPASAPPPTVSSFRAQA